MIKNFFPQFSQIYTKKKIMSKLVVVCLLFIWLNQAFYQNMAPMGNLGPHQVSWDFNWKDQPILDKFFFMVDLYTEAILKNKVIIMYIFGIDVVISSIVRGSQNTSPSMLTAFSNTCINFLSIYYFIDRGMCVLFPKHYVDISKFSFIIPNSSISVFESILDIIDPMLYGIAVGLGAISLVGGLISFIFGGSFTIKVGSAKKNEESEKSENEKSDVKTD